MVHLGLKRYWCPVCGKGFIDLSNLRKHQQIRCPIGPSRGTPNLDSNNINMSYQPKDNMGSGLSLQANIYSSQNSGHDNDRYNVSAVRQDDRYNITAVRQGARRSNSESSSDVSR